MKIITVSSLKGGVGKTTDAVFIARALAANGSRVLCVDLDHNNNLTDYWLRHIAPDAIEGKNVMHALTRARPLEGCVYHFAGHHVIAADIQKGGVRFDPPMISVIPATPSLSRLGIELSRDQGAAMRLRAGLRKLDYDYVIIDTPPSLSLELTLGLYAADTVLVPISASRWTLQGYQIIEQEVANVAESIGITPRILAVPSKVSPIEAAALQESDRWVSTKAAIFKNATIESADSEGRALRDDTLASGWFRALAEEVSNG